MLHITNGDSLTERLQQFDISGDILTWREMLCEGPTVYEVGSPDFIEKRDTFLRRYYDIPEEHYKKKFVQELEKLDESKTYSAIILWFEYDVFCHINMIAAISYIQSKNREESVFLICSGKVQGKKKLMGLAELNDKEFLKHYKERIQLTTSDLSLANTLWEFYCGTDHNKLKPKFAEHSSFTYLSNCLRAHRERFPDKDTGLNTLEVDILKFIDSQHITTKNQLCDYVLSHQGYYGYGDSQIFRIIERLQVFYTDKTVPFTLNTLGQQALIGNIAPKYRIKKQEEVYFGGAQKFKYTYDPENRNLIPLT